MLPGNTKKLSVHTKSAGSMSYVIIERSEFAATTSEKSWIYFFKWHFPCTIESEHYHASNPKKDNITTGFHNTCRVKCFEIFRIWKTKCGKWPLSRRKPSIKCVSIFYKSGRAVRARSKRIFYINKSSVTLRANFCRNRNSPDRSPTLVRALSPRSDPRGPHP